MHCKYDSSLISNGIGGYGSLRTSNSLLVLGESSKTISGSSCTGSSTISSLISVLL